MSAFITISTAVTITAGTAVTTVPDAITVTAVTTAAIISGLLLS